MTENNINSTKKIIQPFEYLNFDAEKEGWNRYKLADGSILKAKFVVINILAEKGIEEKIKKATTEKQKVGLSLSLQPVNAVGVEVSPDLVGEPSKEVCSPDILKEYIVAADLDFETISETWNQYLIRFPRSNEKISLKVKNSPVRISRTSKLDKYGVPIYLVDFTADLRISKIPKK